MQTLNQRYASLPELDGAAAHEAVRGAASRALALAHPVLASVTQPAIDSDPLALWAAARAAHLGDSFLWMASQSERCAIAGVGSALTLDDEGATPIAALAARWREIAASAIASASRGPIAVGGFAFDPLAPRSDLWKGFPSGSLNVPRLAIVCDRETTLTANAFVAADDDPDALVTALEHDLARWRQALAAQAPPDVRTLPVRAVERMSARDWRDLVAEATAKIRRGTLEKVVLARAEDLLATGPFDAAAAMGRLRREFPEATIFACARGEKIFLGATPERLATSRSGSVTTMALAGTAPRGATPGDDAELGEALVHSEKNRIEHAVVVAAIREALAGSCQDVRVADQPCLVRLDNVQHLQTPIAARLAPGKDLLDVVVALHPTPAVGGTPREAALAHIRAGERLDRGWYAGPIGWLSASGDGDFAVALRSGLVCGARATLFAGCGIVAESDPAAEYEESRLKLRAMRRGLTGADSREE
jgi:isochorismate synthase